MAEARLSIVDRQRRLWSFADCQFDEANWTLSVAGQRVAIEAKPLELLRVLLTHSGALVSKGQLLDAIWPDVMVVEASLPTAIRKLRVAIGDDRRDRPIIETVSGIGYRLTVPVELQDYSVEHAAAAVAAPITDKDQQRASPRREARTAWLIVAGLAAISAATAVALWSAPQREGYVVELTAEQRGELAALRKLDLAAVERLVDAGWDVNATYDSDGNGALSLLVNNCEWDRGHDQRAMMLIARTLIDAGGRLDHRNKWGDTPYSIAAADRYCGPSHPVTQMLRAMCYSGSKPLGDRCLATYQLDRSRGSSRKI